MHKQQQGQEILQVSIFTYFKARDEGQKQRDDAVDARVWNLQYVNQ